MAGRGRLRAGEDVALAVRPHWKVLAGPAALVAAGLIGGVLALSHDVPGWADRALAAALVVAAAWLVVRYARWLTTRLVLTTERLILRRGVLARSSREVPLDHLSDISYRQGFLDRLIGAGMLVLEAAGPRGREVVPGLPRPARLQRAVVRQVQARRRAVAAEGDSRPGVAERLRQLDDLRRRGLVSRREYSAKKAELLERI